MKRISIFLIVAVITVTFPFELGHARPGGKFLNSITGQKYYINKSISKSELIKNAAKPKDKIWVVDIWASWCMPCEAAIPGLKNMYEEFKDKDVEFISVSYDAKKKYWIQALKKHEMPWPQILNYNPAFEQDEFKWMFPHDALPTIYLIDKNGTIDQMRGLDDLKYNLRALTAYK
ncbi:MAG: TlpA disulfide reductase family protein [Chitinophagales bacterium]